MSLWTLKEGARPDKSSNHILKLSFWKKNWEYGDSLFSAVLISVVPGLLRFTSCVLSFLTAILHRGLRNDFFLRSHLISIFYLDFFFETFRDISRHFETI